MKKVVCVGLVVFFCLGNLGRCCPADALPEKTKMWPFTSDNSRDQKLDQILQKLDAVISINQLLVRINKTMQGQITSLHDEYSELQKNFAEAIVKIVEQMSCFFEASANNAKIDDLQKKYSEAEKQWSLFLSKLEQIISSITAQRDSNGVELANASMKLQQLQGKMQFGLQPVSGLWPSQKA